MTLNWTSKKIQLYKFYNYSFTSMQQVITAKAVNAALVYGRGAKFDFLNMLF